MSYMRVEVFRKVISFFGIPVWSSVKTVSQEKFYELVSARVKKEVDAKLEEARKAAAEEMTLRIEEIREQVSGDVMKDINEQLGLIVARRKK